MFEKSKYIVDVWKLHRWEKRIRANYNTLHQQARQEDQSQVDREELAWQERTELSLIEDERQQLETRYWQRMADWYHIPTPEFSDVGKWIESDALHRYVLSRQAIAELRVAIRAEERARRESILAWVPGVVGFVGALTGLASVLTHCAGT